jgi:glycine/D-amino acid oxidase-like deaminating enzyme
MTRPTRSKPSRRDALGLAALLAAPACARRRTAAIPAAASSRFAPVQVAGDRIIRTVAGLRPYRPQGFVVRLEKAGDKTVIHNYGHGGGGVTLSWGTARLAIELAQTVWTPRVAVIGAGAVGLATARLLQRRGAHVTIYAKELPPDTTSNIAGAQWWPTSVFEDDGAADEFKAQFVRSSELAHREFQLLVGDRYGVRWLPNYMVADNPPRDSFILGPRSPIAHLFPQLADLGEGATPFARYTRRFLTMMVEPSIYLNAVLADFYGAQGRVTVRAVASVSQMQALPESLIVNCTGLGSRALFGDGSLTPVKGQLTFLVPQPEVDYCLLGGGVYMFPRRDGILLGGTWEKGNWDLTPDRAAEKRLLAAHQALFGRLHSSGSR